MRVKIKKVPKANNGLLIEDDKYKMLSPFTAEILGDKHKDGGTKVAFGGNLVEAEKGEPISLDAKGNAVIFGNMNVPGSKKKFKTVAKDIADAELKNFKMADKASNLINDNSPFSPFGSLAYNSGVALQDAAKQRGDALNEKKEFLGNMQNFMLHKASEMGIEPQKLGKHLKNGGKLYDYAKGGKKLKKFIDDAEEMVTNNSISTEGLDPAYMEFFTALEDEKVPFRLTSAKRDKHADGDFSWHQEGKAIDIVPKEGYSFQQLQDAIMKNPRLMGLIQQNNIGFLNEDPSTGGKLSKHATAPHYHFGNDKATAYKNNPVLQKAYNTLYPNTANPQLPVDVNPPTGVTASNTTSTGSAFSMRTVPYPNSGYDNSGNASYPWEASNLANPYNFGNFQKPSSQQSYPWEARNIMKGNGVTGTPTEERKKKKSLADENKLGLRDFLSEIPALFDRPDFVPRQEYQPQLMTPFQVNMQDQLNKNTSTFRASIGNLNAEEASVLAGQKYQADQSVLANQFRTNQEISNRVYNQNIGIMNDAQLKNLAFSDQQFQRQAQAKSNTDARRQAALASISNKFAQNRKDNIDIKMKEAMFDYRYNPQTGEFEYVGDDANLMAPSMYGNNKKVTKTDPYGNVTTIETEQSDMEKLAELYDNYRKRNTAAKVSKQKWGGFIKKMK